MGIDDLSEAELKELADIQRKKDVAKDNCDAEKRDYANHISDYTKKRYDKARLALEIVCNEEDEFWERINFSAYR